MWDSENESSWLDVECYATINLSAYTITQPDTSDPAGVAHRHPDGFPHVPTTVGYQYSGVGARRAQVWKESLCNEAALVYIPSNAASFYSIVSADMPEAEYSWF